jgi:hypothetical protein
VLHCVVERGLHVIERGRAGVLRSQPIVDRDDEAVGRPGQFDAVRVIGVQISGDESTAVGVHDDRKRIRRRGPPVGANGQRRACRTIEHRRHGLDTGHIDSGRSPCAGLIQPVTFPRQ